MLQYFTIIGMIICGLSSIKHHCGNALFCYPNIIAHVHQDDWSLPRESSQFPSFKWAKFKEVILKPETTCSPFTLVTLNVHASTAHTLATKMNCLITWQVPSNSFSEPFPQHSVYYVEYLKTVNRSCHLFFRLRSCLFIHLCLWRSDLSVCSSVSSLQFVHVFLEMWHPNWANHFNQVV